MTFERLGNFPCSRRGRRTSHSMPFTPTTITFGLGFAVLWFCARSGATRSKTIRNETENLWKPMGNLTGSVGKLYTHHPTHSPVQPRRKVHANSIKTLIAKAAFNPLFIKTRLQFGKNCLHRSCLWTLCREKQLSPTTPRKLHRRLGEGHPRKLRTRRPRPLAATSPTLLKAN